MMVKAFVKKSFTLPPRWYNTVFNDGKRYTGSSRTKGTEFPLNTEDFNNNPVTTATITPVPYKRPITSAVFSGKKTLQKARYTGTFAEQDIKGVSRMVMRRSRSLERVRVAMIAGTVQPNPTSMGTNERPERPILRSRESRTKATRAM